MVAVVGSDRRTHFRKILVARDTGASVEVTSGVKAGDVLVLNPTDEIREGSEVAIETKVVEKGKPAKASN